MRTYLLTVLILLCGVMLAGCAGSEAQETKQVSKPAERPNIVLVVWDTVRADHLSLYGYGRPTTPYLEQWAREARVYDDCITVGSTTVPSHASMFTGLLPSEHGCSNETESSVLADGFDTLAELLQQAGYGTYMFVANPFLAAKDSGHASLSQGFETVDYPWDEQHYREAIKITLGKVNKQDQSHPLAERVRNGQRLTRWNVKACGELMQQGVDGWLSRQRKDQPFFVFLNYMEAHAPLLPPVKYRKQMMTDEQVQASYKVDRYLTSVMDYVFGLKEYTPEEIALTAATYDAAILELDDLFRQLIESLRVSGRLDNTIVILLGDHGDHMGEHHMLDHQFSVYEPLMRIPLVVHYPQRFSVGRDARPVTNLDLFPTLLELVGVAPTVRTTGENLLRARESRPRLCECPQPMLGALKKALRRHPAFNPTPWKRSLRAYYDGPYKFIQGSDGRHELYKLDEDPEEARNLLHEQPEVAKRLEAALQEYLGRLQAFKMQTRNPQVILSLEEQQQLEDLGYLGGSGGAGGGVESEVSTSRPSSRPNVP